MKGAPDCCLWLGANSVPLGLLLLLCCSPFWSRSYHFLSCLFRLWDQGFVLLSGLAEWGFLFHCTSKVPCDNHRALSRCLSMSAGSDVEDWFILRVYSERLENSAILFPSQQSPWRPPHDLRIHVLPGWQQGSWKCLFYAGCPGNEST